MPNVTPDNTKADAEWLRGLAAFPIQISQMTRDRLHRIANDLEALSTLPQSIEPSEARQPGQEVLYINDDDPSLPIRLKATVVGDCEGWVEISMSDGSTGIVRPSRIRAMCSAQGEDNE